MNFITSEKCLRIHGSKNFMCAYFALQVCQKQKLYYFIYHRVTLTRMLAAIVREEGT